MVYLAHDRGAGGYLTSQVSPVQCERDNNDRCADCWETPADWRLSAQPHDRANRPVRHVAAYAASSHYGKDTHRTAQDWIRYPMTFGCPMDESRSLPKVSTSPIRSAFSPS